MRIDEFSNAADIDGTISKYENVRFVSVGFDLLPITWLESVSFNSLITKVTPFDSSITKVLNFNSPLED